MYTVFQSEDIRLDPDLYENCKQDIKDHCQNVVFGNAQVCLSEVTQIIFPQALEFKRDKNQHI